MNYVDIQHRPTSKLPDLKKDSPLVTADEPQDWLSGGGEMSDLIRSKDWSRTALGPLDQWPQSLRTTVSLCLASNFPINIIWGPEAVQIYNVGYKKLCGKVHPRALGESYVVTWASAWPVLGEPFERARLGKTSFLENQRMFLLRNGYLEETFLTFSFSPIRDEHGDVVGLFHPVTETTTAALNQRRIRMLRDISSEASDSENVADAVRRIIRTIADNELDLPNAFICMERDRGDLVVEAATGETESFTDLARWPIAEAYATGEPVLISNTIERFGAHSGRHYAEPIEHACLLPIKIPGKMRPLGFVAVTFSPRLPLNETYMAFMDLLSNAVNSVIARAKSSEDTMTELTEIETDKMTAEAATRAKSEFLANMSHEIRTPLAAILGFTEVLKTPETTEADRTKYLNIISRNGKSLVRIIDDILDLSKIEADKLQMDSAPLCLTALVEDVIAMFSDRAKGKGLTLTFDAADLPKFRIDSDAIRIRQILINLIGNAIKFTTRGGVHIRGSYMAIGNDRLGLTLAVRDSGIGISSDQASTLFQVFTQADNSTTRHYGGTGLGLALSKRLANALGGNIAIENNGDSKGSTFVVNLVVRRSPKANEAPNALQTPSARAPVRRLNDWKILVIDDAEDNRMLMKILLEREGAIATLADCAIDGIDLAHESDFDLILMDIQMPEIDGYQALARLRRENYKKPIFALTAHTMKEERDRALAAGFAGHISKPVDAGALVDTLMAHARQWH